MALLSSCVQPHFTDGETKTEGQGHGEGMAEPGVELKTVSAPWCPFDPFGAPTGSRTHAQGDLSPRVRQLFPGLCPTPPHPIHPTPPKLTSLTHMISFFPLSGNLMDILTHHSPDL